MDGYQSDVNLQDIPFVGDFPLDHNVGGYGIATGINTYSLTLDPAISELREGMVMEVKFQNTNTGASTLNVNGKGAKPIKKVTENGLKTLENGDLMTTHIYVLIFDGSVFQAKTLSGIIGQATEAEAGIIRLATQTIVNMGVNNSYAVTPLRLKILLDGFLATQTKAGFIELATQAETNLGTDNKRAITPLLLKNKLENYLNRETQLKISQDEISSTIYYAPGRNKYSAINGNLIVSSDIILKHSNGMGDVNGWVLNFPKPLYPTGAGGFSGTVFTGNMGKKFTYRIDTDGKVYLNGNFANNLEELKFNINPYVAKFPLEYHDVSPD